MMACRNSPRFHRNKLSYDVLHKSHHLLPVTTGLLPCPPTTFMAPDHSTSSKTKYETMNSVSFPSDLINFVEDDTMSMSVCDDICSSVSGELTQPCSRSPILSHFVPHPPNIPPPDECTTYESILTTPITTPNHMTELNYGVKIIVCDPEGSTIEAQNTAEDAFFV